jgi:hypothetical protein
MNGINPLYYAISIICSLKQPLKTPSRFISGRISNVFGHSVSTWLATFVGIKSCSLRAIFYQSTRKVDTSYKLWQTTKTLIGYIVY